MTKFNWIWNGPWCTAGNRNVWTTTVSDLEETLEDPFNSDELDWTPFFEHVSDEPSGWEALTNDGTLLVKYNV